MVVGARLVQLQIIDHDGYRADAKRRERRDIVESPRGQILDRNGRVLAISIPSNNLVSDPTMVDDPARTAKDVARVLKLNATQIDEQISAAKAAGKRDIVIARDLDADTVQMVNRELATASDKTSLPKYKGLYWKSSYKRSYPHGSTAAQVIGHIAENSGASGIEQSQEKLLARRVSKREWIADKMGRPYEEEVEYVGAASDVVLTIDLAIQSIAEAALERAVKSSGARSGVAIVTDPNNGEILAMANYPTYDPNRITANTKAFVKNLAVETHYDPGSVFKVATYGAGLERGDFKPEDEIDLGNGTLTVGGKTWSAKSGGRITFSHCLATSNNICAIKTGQKAGSEALYSMAQRMGFGKKTGIELPSEATGILAAPATWSAASVGSKSVGYENSASPLQITGAFATIANDGQKFRPHLIKEIRHSDDKPVEIVQVESSQAFTAETAAQLKTMLKQVVVAGTAKRAQLDGYSVAGKTGTAWKYDSNTGSATGQKLISSFVGMAPANSPALVVAVVLDEPKNGGRDAGLVAAPVFSEIAQASLKHLKVAPDQPGKLKAAIAESSTVTTNNDQKVADAKKETLAGAKQAERKATDNRVVPPTKERAKPAGDTPVRKVTPSKNSATGMPAGDNRHRKDV